MRRLATTASAIDPSSSCHALNLIGAATVAPQEPQHRPLGQQGAERRRAECGNQAPVLNKCGHDKKEDGARKGTDDHSVQYLSGRISSLQVVGKYSENRREDWER